MELLSVTMNDGVMPRSEIEGKDNSSEDKSNYKVVLTGDMVYNSMRMWQGANGISPYDGIVSPAYTVLMPKIQIINGYFAALFKSPNIINEFRKNSQGMTSDTWNLKYPQIETIKVNIPALPEQKRIADMLGTLEKRITTQAQLVDSLKKYKRGVIDSLLSQKLTFPGHTVWREKRICDFFTPISDKGHSELTVLTILQGVGTLPRDSIERRITYDKTSTHTYKRVFKDDFILHLRSFEGGLEIANSEGIVSPAYTILRAKTDIVPSFFYAYFRSYWFISNKLRIAVEGIRDGKSINMETFWNITVPYPPLNEQAQIASYLKVIDKTLLCEEDKLNYLNVYRSGLMQQLFI